METSSPNDSAPVSVPVVDLSSGEPKASHGSLGSVLAILLIVVLLVIGAFYVWGQRISEQRAQQIVPAVGT